MTMIAFIVIGFVALVYAGVIIIARMHEVPTLELTKDDEIPKEL
jgi:hypothetical protein